MRAIPPDEFLGLALSGITVLDVRSGPDYALSHLRGSIFIGLSQSFASWAGRLLQADQALLTIAEPGQERFALEALAELGHGDLRGYLEGGFATLQGRSELLASTERIDADALARELAGAESPHLIDVRQPPEWQRGRIAAAPNLPLTELVERAGEVPREGRVILQCQGGYRSLIAASLLERLGYAGLVDMAGGFGAWANAGLPIQPAP
jgi:rhodanese-related sulfurtransferase